MPNRSAALEKESIAMDPPHFTSRSAPPEQLLEIRRRLVDRIWLGLAVVAFLGAPISVSRAVFTGWLRLYGFHVAAALAVVVVYAFRARMSLAVKAALLPLIFWSVGLAGIFTLGVLGVGYWWLVLSSLLVSTLYSVRAGITVAVAATAVLVVAAFAFTSGALTMPVDANRYVVSWGAWGTLLFGAVVTPSIVFQAISAYQQTTLALLDELHEQRDYIERLATHDPLTGLASSRLADDRLEVALHAARRTGRKVALLFIDLDGFKTVNDTLGHDAGDHVLKVVAKLLLNAIRAEDTAARVGGDEFVLVLGGLPDEHVAARVAQRAIEAICRPIDYAGASASVGVSIGIALFPDHASDAKTLRRLADAAMYGVKRSGKNRFAFAEPA